MSKLAKYSAVCLLIMLASTILLALGPTAKAQDETTEVITVYSVGGTVDPAPGTYTYLPDQPVSLTATPDDGYEF